jgi:hypothetical protein
MLLLACYAFLLCDLLPNPAAAQESAPVLDKK